MKSPPPISSRSPGIKLLAVGILGVLLGIPLALVGVLHWERMQRAQEVIDDVAKRAGGRQTLQAPQLAIPYTYEERVLRRTETGSEVETTPRQGLIFVSPAQLELDVRQATRLLHRAIYEVPVLTSEIGFIAEFDGFRLPELPDGAVVDWPSAHWIMGVTDPRGLGQLEVERVDGARIRFEPAADRFRSHAPLSSPAKIDGPDHSITLKGRILLSGVEAVAFTASGVQTKVALHSDWPHPSFDGEFVPAERTIRADGFDAQWWVSNVARGVPEVTIDHLQTAGTWFGVRLVQPGDGYAQVRRSLKYGLLFVALVLGAFLVVELSSRIPVHPAQYGMIGLAQVSFYLLLLALSEHTVVPIAYVVAGGATTALTGMYALWTFGSARFAASIFVSTGISYGFQYTLVQLEDHALLVGATIVFAGLAVLMYATRKIQWYRPEPIDPAIDAELDRLE